MKLKSNLIKEAHKMAREIKEDFPGVDYKTQFGLCMSYLLEEDSKKQLTKEQIIKQLDKIAYTNNMYSYATDWVKGEYNRTYFKLTWYTGNRQRSQKHEKQCGYWDNNKNEYCLENRYTKQYNVFEM